MPNKLKSLSFEQRQELIKAFFWVVWATGVIRQDYVAHQALGDMLDASL